ncbi:MAG: bifunctional DNA-formamidopyrimidine glycosylase/DNA-(apurinic or apyrimidinic site) lyase [gamma proteobacterium symbiont of Taylorina sp.]|nr:bifunctional DNA-formamidopyrimidine glycosylase/DNA-(apurinic or apyrimidinic site) lyase [gamma proteobacterium symbiont of Taylorina sp.]
MPELPEVETTLQGISVHVLNTPIVKVTIRNSSLRWPVPQELASQVIHDKIITAQRRAKYLLLSTRKGTIIIHLGMSGSLRITSPATPYEKHEHVEFCFANGNALRLKDPRRFGAVLWTSEVIEEHPLLKHLGVEPLTEEFNAKYLYQLSRNRKVAIKQFIMDSKVVVGIGNIYANEALFSSGIHPKRAAGRISLQRYTKLCVQIKKILKQAILQGGTTLKDFTGSTGKPGYFKQELLVYGRGGQPCSFCQKPLQEIRQGQRSSVFCSHCQK